MCLSYLSFINLHFFLIFFLYENMDKEKFNLEIEDGVNGDTSKTEREKDRRIQELEE